MSYRIRPAVCPAGHTFEVKVGVRARNDINKIKQLNRTRDTGIQYKYTNNTGVKTTTHVIKNNG